METTEIGAPKLCVDCVFHETGSLSGICRYYPKYKEIVFPRGRTSIVRPAFCRITKIVVFETPLEETWGGIDIKS